MLAANFKQTHQLNCATWPGVKYKCKDIAVCSRSQTQLKYARGVMLSTGKECSQKVKKAAGSTVEHIESRGRKAPSLKQLYFL